MKDLLRVMLDCKADANYWRRQGDPVNAAKWDAMHDEIRQEIRGLLALDDFIQLVTI